MKQQLTACTTCGATQVSTEAHACTEEVQPPAARHPDPPATAWRVMTLALLVSVAAHAATTILMIVLLVDDYRLIQQVQAGSVTLDSPEVAAFADRAATTYALFLLAFLVYVASYLPWVRLSRSTVQRYHGDSRTHKHWTLIAWQIAVAAIVALSFLVHRTGMTNTADLSQTLDSAQTTDRLAIIVHGLRLPVAALLVVGVCAVARRIYTLAASRPPRPTRQHPQIAAALFPALAEPAPEQPDDTLWRDIDDAVGRSANPLPLLEIWAAGPRGRRWHLLASDRIAAVRARLRPGAGIILYTQPPQAPDEPTLAHIADTARRLRDDPATGGAFGLIEESAGGMLRYDHLDTEPALQSWLNRARTAHQAAVYPTRASADPAAIHRTDEPSDP
jgi:hypothetical protein